jgi:hypothetical protein
VSDLRDLQGDVFSRLRWAFEEFFPHLEKPADKRDFCSCSDIHILETFNLFKRMEDFAEITDEKLRNLAEMDNETYIAIGSFSPIRKLILKNHKLIQCMRAVVEKFKEDSTMAPLSPKENREFLDFIQKAMSGYTKEYDRILGIKLP